MPRRNAPGAIADLGALSRPADLVAGTRQGKRGPAKKHRRSPVASGRWSHRIARAVPLPAHPGRGQSACLRRNAGISISSMPLDDSASTLAAAWWRLVRHTLGVLSVP